MVWSTLLPSSAEAWTRSHTNWFRVAERRVVDRDVELASVAFVHVAGNPGLAVAGRVPHVELRDLRLVRCAGHPRGAYTER